MEATYGHSCGPKWRPYTVNLMGLQGGPFVVVLLCLFLGPYLKLCS